MATIPNSSKIENKNIWLVQAVNVAFRCNLVGNCLGWGALICMFIPPLGMLGSVILIWVLPWVVPLILLVNLVVGLMLLGTKIKQGILPDFDISSASFTQGIVSTTLFFSGSALFGLLYFLLIYGAMHSPG